MSNAALTDGSTHASAQRTFDQLYLNTRSRALGFACTLVGNCAEAEDVTQEAYLNAWRHFSSYDSSRPFDAWLLRILANIVFKRHKLSKRLPTCSLDTGLEIDNEDTRLTYEIPDPAPNPEEALLRSLYVEPLQIAYASLPEHYRRVALYAFVEGLSYQEIAERLGCPIGTVRTRVHRARRMLRQWFEWEESAQLTNPRGATRVTDSPLPPKPSRSRPRAPQQIGTKEDTR